MHNNKNSFKTDSYTHITDAASQDLIALYKEVRRPVGKIRAKANTKPEAANDLLYAEMETRYGAGFAQWLVDRMNAAVSKEKA